VSRVASLQVSHGESALRPAAIIPDRFMTKAMTMFLRAVSHRRLSTEISRDLELQRLPDRADRVGRDEQPQQVSPHQERV